MENILHPTLYNVESWENSGYMHPTLFVRWREGYCSGMCDLKKAPQMKRFPRHVHDCREDHTHLISDLWPGSVTEDTQDESTGLRVTEWNWMELFWSDNSTCVKTRKITFMMDSLSLFYFLPLEQTSTVVHDMNLLKNLKSRVFSDFVNETISF